MNEEGLRSLFYCLRYGYIMGILWVKQLGGRMKKLNTLFTNSTKGSIDELSLSSISNMSEIGRAAMSIGLSMLSTAKINMTDREFYSYINDNQDIDKQFNPKPIGSDK